MYILKSFSYPQYIVSHDDTYIIKKKLKINLQLHIKEKFKTNYKSHLI